MGEDAFTIARREAGKAAFQALIDLEKESFKALLLINGGALVAIIAFLGQVLGRQTSTAITLQLGLLRWSMVAFVAGIFCAVSSVLLSYFGSHYNSIREPRQSLSERLNMWSRIMLLLSTLAFTTGCVMAIIAMT